jgi:hypothetical protein
MSQDFNSNTIQRDIEAKKAKLEALRQARFKRQSTLVTDGAETPDAVSPSVLSPNESFEADLDRNNISISNVASPSNGASLNASFNDSYANGPTNVSGMLSPPRNSGMEALSPPSLTRGFSKARLSTSVANADQLAAIRSSLGEIAQHTAAAPPPTFARRPSMSVDMGTSPPPPPVPSTSSANESVIESLNKSVLSPSSSNSMNNSFVNTSSPPRTNPSAAIPPVTLPSDVHPVPPESNEQIDELLEQIQQLNEQIRSNRDDLQMAGDLGSVLLANNEEANAKIDELQQMLDKSNQEILILKDDVRAGDRRAKKLQLHLAEMQHLKEESESEVDILKMELELERQRVRAGEMELLKAQSDHSQADAAAELEAQLSEAKAAQVKHEAAFAALQRQRDDLTEEVKVLKHQTSSLMEELETAEKHQHRAKELTEQLAMLKTQDTVNVITELQYENQRLQDALAELTEHYNHLQEANQRDQDLLRSLQGNNTELQREYEEAKLTTQRVPKPFDSLADDEVLEDSLNSSIQSVPLSQEEKDAAALRAATAAAAMHLGEMTRRKSGSEPARSSLASGSASLAYPDSATVTAATPLKPIAPSAHAMLPPVHSGALSPAATGAMSVPGSSASKPGMFGFLGSLMPHSSNNQQSDSAKKKLNFVATTSHPLSGGGGLKHDPHLKLVQYPAPSGSSRSSGGVWDEDDIPAESGKERNSSHASTIAGRKPGERDADLSVRDSRSGNRLSMTNSSPLCLAMCFSCLSEFFALTLLCVKIHSARKMESLYTVSTQDLWMRAKTEDIQFHQYYPWLEEQLTKAYVSKLAQQKKSGVAEWEENVLDSYLPSNSNVSASPEPPRNSLNTAATRLQLHTPGAVAPSLSNLSAAVVRNVNSSPSASPTASPTGSSTSSSKLSAMMESSNDDGIGTNM